MAIIRQHDKRSGITYAYESHSYWDKDKRMTRAKRTLIGRIDPVTGEIVPTDGRGRKGKANNGAGTNPDYKKLYEGLQKKCLAMETLIVSLQRENKEMKDKADRV
jgi:hypothetical protein